ncbi:MAG: DUF1127 domain-containing protein [Pararhodobacter sp.]
MFNRIRRFFELARDADAVASLSERELADLGVSRDQALNLVSLTHDVPGRVAAMGRIFGLSEMELTRDRVVWRELLETCHHCRALPACRRLLGRHPGGEDARREAAGFCPNRPGFEQSLPTA